MIPVSGYLHRAAPVQGPCKGWQFAELIDYSRSHRAAVTSTYPDDLISRYVGRHDIFCEFHTAITLLQGHRGYMPQAPDGRVSAIESRSAPRLCLLLLKKAQLQMIVGLLTRRSRADAARPVARLVAHIRGGLPSARTSRFVGGHR